MITTLLATLIMAPTAYAPSGPKLVFTMASGKSFTITTDKKGSPKTVAHIISLVKKKFYDGIRFHRVENWVVQWGDPASKKGVDQPGMGSGGSGGSIPFESNPASFTRGVVGIASTGEKVGGDSQLFVVTKDSTFLNGNYAVAGKVTKGMDVIDKVQVGDQIKKVKVVETKK
jgi:cyclophilin family peptidyl-prolyl cis-trans isomerase